MNEELNDKRLTDLKDSIRKDLDLLKNYEDELRYETEPRPLARYRREIERQRESLAQYQQEYDELKMQASPAPMQNVESLLQQQGTKLDKIQRLLPQVWNVPHHRNPNFTGRKDILSNLRLSLTSGESAAWKQAVTGMGGVGKTQLAIEYIYRHKTDYKVIWWIRSEELAAMAADYASLAVDLDLPEKASPDQTEITKAVKHWLEHNSSWLLIFDNARDQKDVRDYLPQGGAGHLIITSRNPDWSRAAKLLPVQIFDRAESIAFLCKRTGQDDRKAADALADGLGDLPLALEQAGAYIETTGRSISDYLKLFSEYQQELLSRVKPSEDYPYTVATTWKISFQEVLKESPIGADLLNLCAYLAPDNIPKELLIEGYDHLPEPLASVVANPLSFDDAVLTLRRYSLIEVTAETLSVHRLVQEVVRDRLSEEDEKRWAGTAVVLLSAAFPFESDDVQTWHLCSRLLPHTLAAAANAEAREVAPEKTSQILNETGVYLHEHGEFAIAKVHLERALILAVKVYGKDRPIVATIVNNLGFVLRDMGNLQGAKQNFKRALKIYENTYGINNPKVAPIVNNLGIVLHDMGDLQGAKQNFERALKIDEKTYGYNHPNVARDVNNLGSLLQDMGDLQGAKQNFERALNIDENAYGLDHPNVARDVNNLGSTLQDMGDLHGAKKKYERALKIDENTYGPDHLKVAIRINNLGSVLQALGDLQGAKQQFERALKINEKTYGPDHPNIAINVNNLGLVLKDMGNIQVAKEHYERAQEIFHKFLGEEHPSTIKVRNNLESLKNVQGRVEPGIDLN